MFEAGTTKRYGLPRPGPAAAAGLCLLMLAAVAAQPAPASLREADAPGDARQSWIARHAVAVRSIDADDEDFRDLEPLIDAIGTARVVQLGEPGHGAGASFAAKVRLIKFLHQRMGFDVVAWESGLYDAHLTQAGLRGGADAATAAQAGILMIWSASAEVQPLFDYAKASLAGARPLEMAGFDSNMNGADASERFVDELRAFLHALRDPRLRRRAADLAERLIAAHERLYARSAALRRIERDAVRSAISGRAPALSRAEATAAFDRSDAARQLGRKPDMQALDEATAGLLALMRRERAAFAQVHAERHLTFMERALDNLRGNDRSAYDRERTDRPAAGSEADKALFNAEWNRRDALNAHNLQWLIEHGYPGRKIVIWAHNVHLMNAYYDAAVSRIHVEPQPGGLVPSGVELARRLGDAVYTIAITSHAGEEGWNSARPVAPAPDGSLEWRLHQLGMPYAFLDLRVLDGSPGHPMRKPLSLRVDKYRDDPLTDVTRAFDAVFFIDRMTAATRLAGRQDGAR